MLVSALSVQDERQGKVDPIERNYGEGQAIFRDFCTTTLINVSHGSHLNSDLSITARR